MNQKISFEQQATQAADFLKMLSSPHRLQVLCLLAGGEEMSVGQLQQHSNLSQSALSQHLAKLREENLVQFRRDGQTLYYSVSDERVLRILMTLKEIFCPE